MEKFEIDVSTFQCIGGEHYYGRVTIPQKRQDGRYGGHYHELEHSSKHHDWCTIRFDTIREIITAATEWFLKDGRVKPGDRLVMWSGHWTERNARLEKPEWAKKP